MLLIDFALGLVAGLLLGGLLYLTYDASKDSVGHFNPAITFGFALTGEMSFVEGGLFALAQVCGGIIGALLAWLFGGETARDLFDLGRPSVDRYFGNRKYGVGNALTLEIFTGFVFFLPFYALFRKARRDQYRTIAPLALGFFYWAMVTSTSGFTRSVYNPAFHLGQSIIANSWEDFWIYVFLPFAGTALGAIYYKTLFVDQTCAGLCGECCGAMPAGADAQSSGETGTTTTDATGSYSS